MKNTPTTFFSRHRRLLTNMGIGITLSVIGALLLGRGPDYPIEWTRDVPSKLPISDLEPALRDMRQWPVYFHDLKKAEIVSGANASVPAFEVPGVGAEILFEMEPRGKEWKRYTVRGKVIAFVPGRRVRLALMEESTGKTTRLLDHLEWEFSILPAEGRWKDKNYLSVIHGEARADTKNFRSRFLGRFADRGLMNQIYWIDLVRLANFIENQATWAGNYAPEYK